MIGSAWNNGKYSISGSGYGIKIKKEDRDRFFNRNWNEIISELEGEDEVFRVNIAKESFWNDTCRELINKNIGIWFIKKGRAPWKKGHPPKVRLENIIENKFKVYIYEE